MNCPICKKSVLMADSSARCHCPADEHVHLLIEWQAAAEHRADKLKDAQRLIDLREQQLADCTRAMREVSVVLRDEAHEQWVDVHYVTADKLFDLADKLDAARSGK